MSFSRTITPPNPDFRDNLSQNMAELDALNAMTTIINQSDEKGELLELVISKVFQPLGINDIAFLLYHPGNQALNLALSGGMINTSNIIDMGRSLIEFNIVSEEIVNLKELPIPIDINQTFSKSTVSAISIPLIGSNGSLGIVLIGINDDNFFNSETDQFLSSLGRQIAIGLEKVRLLAETKTWADQMEKRVEQKTATITLINSLNEALNQDDPSDAIYAKVNQTIQEIFDTKAISIDILNREEKKLVTQNAICQDEFFELEFVDTNNREINVFSEDKVYWEILRNGQPYHPNDSDSINSLLRAKYLPTLIDSRSNPRFSIYVFPLISKNTQLGLLKVLRTTPLNDFEISQLSLIINQFSSIIERKLAEEKLLESDLRYRELYDSAPVAYFTVGAEGLVHRSNQGAERLLGIPREQIIDRNIFEFYTNTSFGKERARQVFRRCKNGEKIRNEELQMCSLDGNLIWANHSVDPVLDESGKFIESRYIIVDITDRKNAEERIHLQSKALEVAANAIVITDFNGAIQWANQAFTNLTGYTLQEVINQNLRILKSGHHDQSFYANIWSTIRSGNMWQGEIVNTHKDGSTYFEEMTITPVQNEAEGITHFIAIKQDISERAQSQKKLQKQVDELKALHKFATHSVEVIDEDFLFKMATDILGEQLGPQNFGIMLLNEQTDTLKYHQSYQWASTPQKLTELPLGTGIPGQVALTGKALKSKDVNIAENSVEANNKNNSEICEPLKYGNRVQGVIHAEKTHPEIFSKSEQRLISTLAAQLSSAIERARFFKAESERRHISETLVQSFDGLTSTLQLDEVLGVILDELGSVLPYDTATVQLLKGEKVTIVASQGFDISENVEARAIPINSHLPNHQVIINGKALSSDDLEKDFPEPQRAITASNGRTIRSWLGLPLILKNKTTGMISVERTKIRPFQPEDKNLAMAFANQAATVIENARLFSEADKRMQRLASLRNIDQAISNSLDGLITMNIVLNQVVEQLNVDAAAALLYDRDIQMLEFAAGVGFTTTDIQNTNLRIGQGYPGIAVLERRMIRMPIINYQDNCLARKEHFKNENFVSYFGVPLLAKGQIVGVIEVFKRTLLEPDNEWVDFLETLAGQAAIAIDNNNLFNYLQRSNDELIMAYDATIEGWAKTLEIRDVETEGHSRRVVDLSIQLARKLNIHGEDLAHIRRGALLHDIGKIGIPDSILYKKGPLDEEEWKLMRMHPVYAYQLLSSIDFLRPALDIPYCHHEKWDGTGYPRGLMQEQIPIAARIFSLVDVWDALTSDRPYRKAWDEEKTLSYIKMESGSHFDPDVVNVFLESKIE